MITNYKPKYILAAIGFFLVSLGKAYSQDIPKQLYSASGIPDSLKEDANSVVRYNLEEFDVRGPGKAVIKVHSIVTVLNEKGNREAEIVLPYNRKFSSVSSFEMIVYDADGKVLKKYHKSDMYEHAAQEEETLVTDDRLMIAGHTIANYPTTIEMVYEIDRNSMINIGQWSIQQSEQSIQNSSCRLTISADAGFQYLNRNTGIKPQKTNNGGKDIYTWQVTNLKAFKPEAGTMLWRVVPEVLFSQNKFEYYGVPGDISNWQNYGKWQQALNSDVCTLSPQRVAEIKRMTDTIKTDKEKARFLYKYLQQSMRYVNIKLGIGGLKPLPATFVDEKKYGDCKALSNYMYALLKAVDIPSYFTVVTAGANEEPADAKFPFDGFNHIILCIPFKNDTTWLECTDSHQPFGLLGSFTENRNALLVTEDGGRLVNTPKSTPQENQFNSEAHITLQPDGSAKTHIKILSTGEYRGLYIAVTAAKLDEQKQFWQEQLNMKQPSALDVESGKDAEGIKQIDLDLEYDKFCDVMAGDKQFYQSAAFKLWANTVPVTEKRKTDFYWEWPKTKSCVTTIDLPQGFEVESLPANASLKFSYGNYDLTYVYNKDKNQVVSTARFVLNNQVIPAAKYTEMQQFMDAVVKAQNKKLVIHKKA